MRKIFGFSNNMLYPRKVCASRLSIRVLRLLGISTIIRNFTDDAIRHIFPQILATADDIREEHEFNKGLSYHTLLMDLSASLHPHCYPHVNPVYFPCLSNVDGDSTAGDKMNLAAQFDEGSCRRRPARARDTGLVHHV